MGIIRTSEPHEENICAIARCDKYLAALLRPGGGRDVDVAHVAQLPNQRVCELEQDGSASPDDECEVAQHDHDAGERARAVLNRREQSPLKQNGVGSLRLRHNSRLVSS